MQTQPEWGVTAQPRGEDMGDVRVRIANLAMELFPHYGDTTQALKSLIAIANEIIQDIEDLERMLALPVGFQWAPTLGGECYGSVMRKKIAREMRKSFNGHPPLGVNATIITNAQKIPVSQRVSMGTHPWG